MARPNLSCSEETNEIDRESFDRNFNWNIIESKNIVVINKAYPNS